jgi:hypothetical protein
MKRNTAHFLVVATLLVASGSSRAADSWTKALAKRGIDPSLVEDPIRITPEIKTAADAMAGRSGGTVDQLKRLQSGLFDAARFTFAYDARLTETAAEALASGRGDCVAFTNLFIAMARSRGLRVQAGYIQPRATGEKRGDLIFVSTHVVAVYQLHDRYIVFDFYKTREDRSQQIRLLDDLELAALYVNNRAVLALSAGLARAEALFTAVLSSPRVRRGGNLGVHPAPVTSRVRSTPTGGQLWRRVIRRSSAPRGALFRLGRHREAKAARCSRICACGAVHDPGPRRSRGRTAASTTRSATTAGRRGQGPGSPTPRSRSPAWRVPPDASTRHAARRSPRLKLDPENKEAREILEALPGAGAR